MKSELELVTAAGFDPSKLSLIELYDIGGRIIHDEQLRREMLAAGNPLDRVRILRCMHKSDLAALRDRVKQ
jgi:hypothetical protein